MNDAREQVRARLAGGVVPAMATPLLEDGYHVNSEAVAELVDFLIRKGVKGLFVGGTTGEGILLAEKERRLLHSTAIDAAAGRVPLLIHVGANTIAASVELTKHAAACGADALVAITPTFYDMTDDALLGYYETLAAAAPGLPLFAYDIPHMARNGVAPELLSRLAEAIPTFTGLKSSRPDAQVVRKLIDFAPATAAVYAGNEAIALGLLALGAEALISGLATAVPEPFIALTAAFAAGDLPAARQQQRIVNRLLEMLPAGARIGALKLVLEQRGIAAGPPVPPRPKPELPDLWHRMETLIRSK